MSANIFSRVSRCTCENAAFCPAEDKVWTTVMNNLPPRTAVTGSSRERRTVLQVNYSATMDQVRSTHAG